uniref:Putative secreted protein n=1 Tax=Anopheles marajoara TaxID=58244 RepID=A0A2M4CB51_9DIPT
MLLLLLLLPRPLQSVAPRVHRDSSDNCCYHRHANSPVPCFRLHANSLDRHDGSLGPCLIHWHQHLTQTLRTSRKPPYHRRSV